ncbi:hypothetical protein BC830DRAFT_514901 [Chytriomyces sp. MP71]|nr:hypothetical protein BC830DRAFT_514901 [Chytriomyces sp. MP71]
MASPGSSVSPSSAGLGGFLATELMLLMAEAKRKNADVKDAAELLLALVKTLKPPAPGGQDLAAGELARSSDTVRPFLLACDSKNPKLVPIAVGCLQRLTLHRAIPESCVARVMKCFADPSMYASSADGQIHLKVLQTVLPLLTGYKNVGGEVIAEALMLCYHMQESKTTPVVNSIASATLRQVVLYTFEKVEGEDDTSEPVMDVEDVSNMRPFARDAYRLFQDLCQLAIGEQTSFWKVSGVPKTLCLELMESILSSHWKLFKKHESLLSLVKERACPILMRSFSDKSEFSLNVRLMRLIHIIVKQFHDALVMECEIFLSLFVKLLETDHGPPWIRVLVLEAIKGLCASEGFLRSIFQAYDAHNGSTKVFAELLAGVGRILVAEKQAGLIIPRELHENPTVTGPSGQAGLEMVGFANSAMKVPCLEQLEKSEAPMIPENYFTVLCIQCILSGCDVQVAYLLTRLQAANPADVLLQGSPVAPGPPVLQDELILALEMASAAFPSILAVLSILLIGNVEQDVYKATLRTYCNFTVLLGLLGLVQQRDALLETLCRVGTPASVPLSFDANAAVREMGQFSLAAAQNFSTRVSHVTTTVLAERNLSVVVAACNIALQLRSVLDKGSWYIVLETLQAVEGLHSSGKIDRRETVNAVDSVKMMEGGRKISVAALATIAAATMASGSGGSVELNLQLASKNLFEYSKLMNMKSLKEFISALCLLSRDGANQAASNALEKKAESGKSGADEKLFAITKLHEVFMLNNDRIIDPPGEEFHMVVNCLTDIAHSANCTFGIRNQVCAVFGELLVNSIQCAEVEEGHGIRGGAPVELKLLEPLRRFMLVGADDVVPTGVPISAVDSDRIIKGPWFPDVQRAGLETVKRILMSSGHNLAHGWFLVFEVIRSVVAGGNKKGGASGAVLLLDTSADTSASSASKSANLVRTAFPSIQLVCGDFLGSLGPDVLYECIQTLGVFGSQQDDINISLTTIGLLWNISDNILMRRQKLEKDGKWAESPSSNKSFDSASVVNLITSAIGSTLSIPTTGKAMMTSRDTIAGPITTKTMDILWMHLLAHLSQLCSDLRPEVRNSANQTIFKTIAINGKRLTLEAWDECIWNILFPLLERVKISSEQAELVQQAPPASGIAASGIPINPRDSPTKFWNETKTLTLTGITSLIISFFPVLIELDSGFERAWNLFLDYIRSWSLGGSPEVAAAAIKSFKTLARYPKDLVDADGSPGKVPANIESKLQSLWRVAWDVWEGIGLGIVASADENKDKLGAPVSVLKKTASGFGSQLIEVDRLQLLHGSFPQATLVQYVAVFGDIYDVISGSFGLYELKKLLNVLSSLLLYHTNSAPGATASKYRTDNILDLDSMTPYQEAAFNLITGTTHNFSSIKGASEVIMLSVSGFIRLPFVRLQSLSDEGQQQARQQPQTGGMEKGFTYIAIAKRSMQTLVTLFETHGSVSTVYSGGIFEAILACFDVPMRAKYDCPHPGVKDSTPIWRVAANSAMTFVVMGLRNLDRFVTELPKDILNGIYTQILDMFDGFLLPQSTPPASLSLDELEVATDFDISIFETFEADVLLHLGQLHVPDELIKDHIQIICRGSRLYRSHMSSMTDLNLTTSLLKNGSLNGGPGIPLPLKKLANEEPTSTTSRNSIARASLVSSPKPGAGMDSPFRKPTLGTDVMPLGREKFAKACLSSLLKLCSDELNDFKDVRYRIATIAAPVVLDKMRETVKSYASDRPLYGKLPLPRIRNEEILIVLSNLRDLQMRVGILHDQISEDKIHPLRSHILSGRSAHIFYLYPFLCDLLAAVAKAGRATGHDSPADGDEESVVDLVRSCLARVGREMGLDN